PTTSNQRQLSFRFSLFPLAAFRFPLSAFRFSLPAFRFSLSAFPPTTARPMASYRIGIIGGSGLYHIAGFTDQKWVSVRTPFGPPSDAFLTGRLRGREVVFLPRHSRGHRLLPSELNHRANLWAMKKLGVAWVISVSAVGSLQTRYRPC